MASEMFVSRGKGAFRGLLFGPSESVAPMGLLPLKSLFRVDFGGGGGVGAFSGSVSGSDVSW